MKTITLSLKIIILSLLLVNCSSSDDAQSNTPVVPATVTTEPVGEIVATSVVLNGRIVSPGNYPIYQFGFCVSPEPNPTTADQVFDVTGSPNGNFTRTISILYSNNGYHVRAFAKTLAGTTYGQDLTFSTEFYIESAPVTNILPKSATFKGQVMVIPEIPIFEFGYCYGTSPNPTPANNTMSVPQFAGSFEKQTLNDLLPNTVYYARPYLKTGGDTFQYGNEISFKTTGYFGPGGGYVFYDKGSSTDGWRYMEIHPQTVNYASTASSSFGCGTSFLSNTYPEIGKGLANTSHITANCASANCAARLCENLVRGGQSDWFLGSREEMLTAAKALRSINVNIDGIWTSTEIDNDEVYYIYYNINNFASGSMYKGSSRDTYPIRRY